jgi:hypothetical protein
MGAAINTTEEARAKGICPMTRIKSDDDEDKILKDGKRIRISMMMRDSAIRDGDAKPQFTDGRTTDATALHRPGFRVPVVQDRTKVRDAYAADAVYLRNRYKCGDGERLCDDCGGEGYDQDGNVCDTCHGKGVMPVQNDGGYHTDADAKTFNDLTIQDQTIQDRIRDHRQNVARLHSQLDAELQDAWRRK